MNPIDELRAARPAHLGDTPVDERTRAAELSYAMSRPRSARRKRRIVRPVWGFSLVGAAAAATAVAVVVSGTGGTTPRAPDAAPATVTSSTPKVRLSARDILLTAAAKAARQPAGTGAYWHTMSVERTLFAVEGADYLVMDRHRNERWTPSATGGDLWSSTKSLGARPATAADEEAWKQAGSPTEIPVKPRPMTLSTSPRKMSTDHSPLTNGDTVFWLGRKVTMKDLRDLPADPAKLKAWLLRSYERHGIESSSDPKPADAWLFSVSAGLIIDMPVTPQVRAAAFRMLAALDTVDVIENVTDAEGRQGTAVAIEERTKGSGVLENRLIFDQATGRGLANENVVVKPGGLPSDFEPGTVWFSHAVLEAGWTDSKPSF